MNKLLNILFSPFDPPRYERLLRSVADWMETQPTVYNDPSKAIEAPPKYVNDLLIQIHYRLTPPQRRYMANFFHNMSWHNGDVECPWCKHE